MKKNHRDSASFIVVVVALASLARATSATCASESASAYNKTSEFVANVREAYEAGCESSCATATEPFFQTQLQNFTSIGAETESVATLTNACESQGFRTCKANMRYKATTANPLVQDAVVEVNVREVDKPVCVPKSCETVDQVFAELLPYTNIACTIADGRQCEFYEQTLDCEDDLGTVVGQCSNDLPGVFNQLSIARGVLSAAMNLYCTQSTVPGVAANEFCRTENTNGERTETYDFTSFVNKRPAAYNEFVSACERNVGRVCHVDFELRNTPAVNGVPGLLDLAYDYTNYPVCLSDTAACALDDDVDVTDANVRSAVETLLLEQITGTVGIDTDGIPFPDVNFPGTGGGTGTGTGGGVGGNINVPNPTADTCDPVTGLCDVMVTRLSCAEALVTPSPTPSPTKAPTKRSGSGSGTSSDAEVEGTDGKGDGNGDGGTEASFAVAKSGDPSLLLLGSIVALLGSALF